MDNGINANFINSHFIKEKKKMINYVCSCFLILLNFKNICIKIV